MDSPFTNSLIVAVGLPGSGKSSFLESKYANLNTHVIINTDDIRKDLYGDSSDSVNEGKVFSTAYQKIKEAIDSGKVAIFDSSNISVKSRKNILKHFTVKDYPTLAKVAIFFSTPYTMCKSLNKEGSKSISDEVIDKMVSKLRKPSCSEGFDMVIERKLIGDTFVIKESVSKINLGGE